MLEESASLGRRLFVRRRELEHRMIDAAPLAGVDVKTWMWWERDEHKPTVGQYPAIIRYLGHEPWPEPVTLGERLLAQRRRRGLSIKAAAIETGVDEGTFGRWEGGVWQPQSRSIARIEGFLGGPLSRALERPMSPPADS